MNNEEITEYMHGWIAQMKSAPSKETSIMGAVIGIVVMLAEIAKRLPSDQKTPDQNQETMGFPGSPQGDDSWK